MPDTLSYPDVATLASPLYLLLLVLELLLMRLNLLPAHYETRDSAASLSMGVGYVITCTVSGGCGPAMSSTIPASISTSPRPCVSLGPALSWACSC